MDRNSIAKLKFAEISVATREGGVDRNNELCRWAYEQGVATREGGVDRNVLDKDYNAYDTRRHPRGWRG